MIGISNGEFYLADTNYILKMYPPFVTQKVEPKCAATDAASESRGCLHTMPNCEEENKS